MQSCKKFAFASSAGHRERDRVNSVDLKKITILRRKRSGISGMAGTGKGGWEVHKIKEFNLYSFHPTACSRSLIKQKDAISLAMVDLPLPEGPTRAFTVPARKVRSMPCSTSASQ